MEHRAGKPMQLCATWNVAEKVADEVSDILEEIHRRGVTHGDLHGMNVLINLEGDVSLIDWATACVFGAHPRGSKRIAFNEWRALDERALAKIKLLAKPFGLTPREQELLLHDGTPAYRAMKILRHQKPGARRGEEAGEQRREMEQDRISSRIEEYSRLSPEAARLRLQEEKSEAKRRNKEKKQLNPKRHPSTQ
jgi:serine/threonine protein kinase